MKYRRSAVVVSGIALLALTSSGCQRLRSIAGLEKEFRFTVTADSRENRKEFRHVLSQVTQQTGGEGAFHVSIGDIDPVIANHTDFVREFGPEAIWLPIVGNHDTSDNDIVWIRGLTKRLPFEKNPGPTDCPDTTFSFDYQNAHFVVLDFYNGEKGSRFAWLEADLGSTRKPAVFVLGHQPMFGNREKDKPDYREEFWSILMRHDVTAYICGHSHVYEAKQPMGSRVWHVDVGNAGNDSHSKKDGQTFVEVKVQGRRSQFNIWRGEDEDFEKEFSWTVE